MSDMKPFEWPVYAVKMKGSVNLYFFDPSFGNRYNTGDGWLVLLPWGEERKVRPFGPDNRVIREPEEVEWMEQLNATHPTPPASTEALSAEVRGLIQWAVDLIANQMADEDGKLDAFDAEQFLSEAQKAGVDYRKPEGAPAIRRPTPRPPEAGAEKGVAQPFHAGPSPDSVESAIELAELTPKNHADWPWVGILVNAARSYLAYPTQPVPKCAPAPVAEKVPKQEGEYECLKHQSYYRGERCPACASESTTPVAEKPDPYCVPGPDGKIACPTCAVASPSVKAGLSEVEVQALECVEKGRQNHGMRGRCSFCAEVLASCVRRLLANYEARVQAHEALEVRFREVESRLARLLASQDGKSVVDDALSKAYIAEADFWQDLIPPGGAVSRSEVLARYEMMAQKWLRPAPQDGKEGNRG